MLSIKVICTGKLKERYYKETCAEYVKRIGPLAKLEVCELPEEPDRPGALEREAERASAEIPSGAYVIALCIEGRPLSSQELSDRIEGMKNAGISRLCVLIGSSCGMDQRLKDRADLRLSMSPMTFPHHLARVMVLEQLYRALSIAAGSRYHK